MALAKSLLGNMTGVREAVPAQGLEMRREVHAEPFLLHIHTPSSQHLLPGLETLASSRKEHKKVISPPKRYKTADPAGLGQYRSTIYHSAARKAL